MRDTSEIRSLVLTCKALSPPRDGARIRNWQNINLLAPHGRVGAVCISPADWLPPTREEAGLDMERTFVVGSGRDRLPTRALRWVRPALGDGTHPTVRRLYSRYIASELEVILASFRPDLAIFEEPWLLAYLPLVRHRVRRVIYDAHNAEASLTRETAAARSGGMSRFKVTLETPRVMSMEQAYLAAVDQLWVSSEHDAAELATVYQHRVPTHVIPNGVDVRYYESVRLGHCPPPDGLAAGPHAFVFVASFSHPPNAFAAKVILDQVYPRLRARYPDCRVLLVGRDPTPHMMKVAGRDPHVAVTGEVADVRPYLAAAKASIVPLQHGAGTRFKIVEAFAAGVPVVSTSKGDEGLDVVPGRHLLRADTPQQFADALHELFSAPSLRQRLIAAAFDLVRREYSREAVGQRVTRALQHLISQSPPRGGAVSASAG